MAEWQNNTSNIPDKVLFMASRNDVNSKHTYDYSLSHGRKQALVAMRWKLCKYGGRAPEYVLLYKSCTRFIHDSSTTVQNAP